MSSQQNPKDYYDILGVPKNASGDEIKSAFKESAKKLSPSVHNVPEGQKPDPVAYEKWISVNEAYGVLSNEKKRKEYDSLEGVNTRVERNSDFYKTEKGEVKLRPEKFESMFSTIFDFGGESMFPNGWDLNYPSAGDFFTSKPKTNRKSDDWHVYLTREDMGLFKALIAAYESKSDGKWDVKKADDDKRELIQQTFYRVIRENGDVRVLRTVSDWRDKRDRDKPILIKDTEKPWDTTLDKEIQPNHLLGESYLAGSLKDRIRYSSLSVPIHFDTFLFGMKGLAKKLSGGEGKKIDNTKEIDEINVYYSMYPRGIRKEDSTLYKEDKERSVAYKINSKDFWKRVGSEGNVVVQKEGQNNKPEGNGKIG